MDALEACLQQHPQGAGAAALLQGFAAAVMAGDVALQLLLLLLQAAAGALLQGQGFGQLLHLEAQVTALLLQALLVGFQLMQLLLGAAAPLALLGQLSLQLRQPFLLLAQPFAELMLFRL